MIRAVLLPASLSVAILTGCTSPWQRSFDRWYDYRFGQGPYAEWAACIEQRSRHYLEHPRPAEGTDTQLFALVLADCASLMAGPAWEEDGRGKLRQLIGDAYRAFESVNADIQGALAASIT